MVTNNTLHTIMHWAEGERNYLASVGNVFSHLLDELTVQSTL